MAKRGRRRKEDEIVDAVLRILDRQDKAGELRPSELTATLQKLAVFRGISEGTVKNRWKELRLSGPKTWVF